MYLNVVETKGNKVWLTKEDPQEILKNIQTYASLKGIPYDELKVMIIALEREDVTANGIVAITEMDNLARKFYIDCSVPKLDDNLIASIEQARKFKYYFEDKKPFEEFKAINERERANNE